MSKAEVRRCSCPNLAQDQLHGTNMRVHNAGVKGWRCTSCLTVSGTAVALVGSKGGKK